MTKLKGDLLLAPGECHSSYPCGCGLTVLQEDGELATDIYFIPCPTHGENDTPPVCATCGRKLTDPCPNEDEEGEEEEENG